MRTIVRIFSKKKGGSKPIILHPEIDTQILLGPSLGILQASYSSLTLWA